MSKVSTHFEVIDAPGERFFRGARELYFQNTGAADCIIGRSWKLAPGESLKLSDLDAEDTSPFRFEFVGVNKGEIGVIVRKVIE